MVTSSMSSSRSTLAAGGGIDPAPEKARESRRDTRSTKKLLKAAKTILKRRSDRELELGALVRALENIHPLLSKRESRREPGGVDEVGAVCSKALRSALKGSKRFRVVVEEPASSSSLRAAGASPELVIVRLTKRTKKNSKKADVQPPHSSSVDSSTDRSVPNPSGAEVATATALWRTENKVVVVIEPQKPAGAGWSQDQLPERHLLPIRSFDDLKTACDDGGAVGEGAVPEALLRHLRSRFQRPSPIQAQAWPVLLGGYNLVGIAETGSGKTLGFCIPALVQLASSSSSHATENDRTGSGRAKKQQLRGRPVRMLVLSPTRELALQSHAVLEEYGALVNVSSLVVYGGVHKSTQEQALRRGDVDTLVATPGRLKDLLSKPSSSRGRNRGERDCDGPVLDLSAVQYLVLDEADRMLDLGFIPDVLYIVSRCTRSDRQTCLFSATWPASVQKIAANLLNTTTEDRRSHSRPAFVRVYVGFEVVKDASDAAVSDGNSQASDTAQEAIVVMDDALSANKRVKQTVEVLEDHQRESRLHQLLSQVLNQPKKGDPRRVLVFCLYKKEAERLEYRLKRAGYNCASIHGNKAQSERTRSLDKFKSGEVPLLIATDVAARGLHIPSVYMVINYTFPLTIEDYVHRIGRTGRAGQSGQSVTFFQPLDKARAGELQQVMRQAGQEIPEALAKFGSTVKRKEHKLYGDFAPSGPMKKATKITFNYSDDESTK